MKATKENLKMNQNIENMNVFFIPFYILFKTLKIFLIAILILFILIIIHFVFSYQYTFHRLQKGVFMEKLNHIKTRYKLRKKHV